MKPFVGAGEDFEFMLITLNVALSFKISHSINLHLKYITKQSVKL